MKTPALIGSSTIGSELMQLRLLRGVRPASDAGGNGSRGRRRAAGSLTARRCRLRTLARLKRQLPRLCASVQLHCCSPPVVACTSSTVGERTRAASTVWLPSSTNSSISGSTIQPRCWQQQQHQEPPVVCMATVATHFGFRVATCRAGQINRPACQAAVQMRTPSELCQRLALAHDHSPTIMPMAATAAVASVTSCCLPAQAAAELLRMLDLTELVTKACGCTDAASASSSFNVGGTTDDEEEDEDTNELLLELLSRPSQQQERQQMQQQQLQQRQKRQRRSRRLPTRRRLRLLPDASESWDLPFPTAAAPSTDGVLVATTSSSCAPSDARHQLPAASMTSSMAPTGAAATGKASGNVQKAEEEDDADHEEELDGEGSCSGDSAFFTCSLGRPRRQRQQGTEAHSNSNSNSSSSSSSRGGELVDAAAEAADARKLDGDEGGGDNKDCNNKDCREEQEEEEEEFIVARQPAAVVDLAVEARRGRRLRRRCLGLTRRLRAALLLLEAAPPATAAATRVRDLLGQALAALQSSSAAAADCAVSRDTLCCIDLDAAAAASTTAATGGDCDCGASAAAAAAGLAKKASRSHGNHRRHRRQHRRWQLGAMKNDQGS